MLTRIVTAVVALIVFFAVVFAGELPLQIAIGIVILAMLYEVYGALTKSAAVKTGGYICALILMAGIMFGFETAAVSLIVTVTMIFLVFMHGRADYKEIFAVFAMTLYVTLFMSFIPRLRIERGLGFMMLIFIIAWGSDTFAYFGGTFFGKHKLIPKVSPKKTVEGSVCAVICASGLCMLYLFIMNKVGYPLGNVEPSAAEYAAIALIGAAGSVLSQIGDLAASAIKRDADIKDYGKIFPGHGGFMDRFDSVIFITPIVYYLIINVL